MWVCEYVNKIDDGQTYNNVESLSESGWFFMFQDFKFLIVEFFVFNSHMHFPLKAVPGGMADGIIYLSDNTTGIIESRNIQYSLTLDIWKWNQGRYDKKARLEQTGAVIN